MRAGLFGCVLAGAVLAGCVHDGAAPPDPKRFPTAFAARRLQPRPDGARWSRADLLTVALADSPSVAEAQARYRTALASARAARVRPAIGLSLTAEYANETPHWGYTGLLDIPLDQDGRRAARLSTADLTALQGLYDFGEAVWAVRTAIDRALAQSAGADEQIALAERAVVLRQDRLNKLEKRVAAGEDARTFSLVARTELTAGERRLADLKGQRQQARLALAKAVGVDPGQVEALPLDTATPSFDPAALPAWKSEATLSRRDVLRALADYDLAETALRLEIAKQYPELRLQPGYNYDHGVTKLPFTLALVLPPADLNRAAIAAAEAKRAEAGRALEAIQANVLAGVDQAQAALAVTRSQSARAAELDLPAARRAAAAAAASARVGETDRTDQLAAEAAELDARIVLIDAERAAAVALVDLEDALRRPFDPAEAVVLAAAVKADPFTGATR